MSSAILAAFVAAGSLFITVESVSCDFTQQSVVGQTISSDSWHYIEAGDGENSDVISEVDIYQEFNVPAEEVIDIGEI